jgi:flagellar biosynthesis protein FlhG
MNQKVKQVPRILAVGSGKGGVGKTTTSVNLALLASRQGIATLLVDADPLSDIATLLDIEEPENVLDGRDNMMGTKDGAPRVGRPKLELPRLPEALGDLSLLIPVFKDLNLLIPRIKRGSEFSLKPDNAASLSRKILESLFSESRDLLENYRLVILDLAAGIPEEESLDYLGAVDQMLVVTNDEPTSHVASGTFIRFVSSRRPDLPFKIWHNKYQGISRDGFDPRDLPGNYNRNVAGEERLDFGLLSLEDCAFIPQDVSLDLLQSSPDLNLNIKRQMMERIEMMYRERIVAVIKISSLPVRLSGILVNYFFPLEEITGPEEILGPLAEQLKRLLSGQFFSALAGGDWEEKDIFSEEEGEKLRRIIEILKTDNLSLNLRRLRRLLGRILEEEENSQRLFFQERNPGRLKTLDRELGLFLGFLAGKSSRSGAVIRNLGGLLLYDFALFKLFQSETIRNLIINFIPWRKNSRGRRVRDKNQQIRWLVEDDNAYRQRFLRLVKTLFPVLLSQLNGVSEALALQDLLFRRSGALNQEVYLRLLTSFLHDVLNSGLGVVIGFRYRPASRAFSRGAALVLPPPRSGQPAAKPPTDKSPKTTQSYEKKEPLKTRRGAKTG